MRTQAIEKMKNIHILRFLKRLVGPSITPGSSEVTRQAGCEGGVRESRARIVYDRTDGQNYSTGSFRDFQNN
ncbi:hypothetical protein AOLI_G00075730 [Acnodon oligacanthus]